MTAVLFTKSLLDVATSGDQRASVNSSQRTLEQTSFLKSNIIVQTSFKLHGTDGFPGTEIRFSFPMCLMRLRQIGVHSKIFPFFHTF